MVPPQPGHPRVSPPLRPSTEVLTAPHCTRHIFHAFFLLELKVLGRRDYVFLSPRPLIHTAGIETHVACVTEPTREWNTLSFFFLAGEGGRPHYLSPIQTISHTQLPPPGVELNM